VAVQLAVALPYGPSLNGVLGRPAGTVPGYEYSRAFLAALRGVLWTRATLDRWITDSPAWVPGAIMVYRQPDPAIRARIIDYLEHPEGKPASRRTMPTQGGEIDGRLSMMSSAIRR
jgi:cytochrome c2